MSHTINFDLELSNSIFKANLESLVRRAHENSYLTQTQNEEFIKQLIKNSDRKDQDASMDDSELSHLGNIDWLILNSIYTAIFAHFERHLFTLARIIEKRSCSKFKINDLSGKGLLDKYFNYIRLVGGINSIDPSRKPWQNIVAHQKVRNLIVHNGGMMMLDLNNKLEKHPSFKFLISHKVVIAGSFGLIRIRTIKIIEEFAKTSQKISDIMTSTIKERFPEKQTTANTK